MELYGFMEREKKIPSYFFIITKQSFKLSLQKHQAMKITTFKFHFFAGVTILSLSSGISVYYLVELLYALDTCNCISNGEIGMEELAHTL